jgi:iron complex outermembrane receptor protein
MKQQDLVRPRRLGGSGIFFASTLLLAMQQLHAAEQQQVQQLDAISVYADDDSNQYGSRSVNLTGFGSLDLAKVPASIATISADLIADRQIKVLSEVAKNDASLGDGYAAIGYYQNIVSRGFALDLASSYLINGHNIRGEQTVMLENKERVEILKGISAIQSGMSTPGGVVNYVSKRPKQIREIRVDGDSNGGSQVALDLGGFVGQHKQFGYRLNVGAESVHPYVEHSNGKRYFAGLALDWTLSEQAQLQLDLETQYHRQPSVPGYMLLNGKVPTGVDWDRLLGYASESPDVATHSLNTQLKYSYSFNPAWKGFLSASHSKVVIDDRVYFPWGCYSTICTPAGGSFDANGNYDLYNYVQPDDTRKTNQYKAGLNGRLDTAGIQHQLALELSHTDKTRDRYVAINQVIGTGNIYSDQMVYNNDAADAVGNRYRSLSSKQNALFVSDRITFNPQWSAILGLKWLELDEKAYSSTSALARQTQLHKLLPQFALLYSPAQNSTLYASYAKGLSDGNEAPWYANNSGTVLAPVQSRQYELGLKHQIGGYLLGVALFDLQQDNQYARPDGAGSYDFIAEGKQHNQGIELSATGQLSPALQLSSSLAYIRAQLSDLSYADYEGHQTQNVPKFRLTTQLSYALPRIEGLRLLAGLLYSSSKYADKLGRTKVDGYSVFDLGAAYQFKAYAHDASLRVNVENLFNQKYWRDVGAAGGDDYLFLGSPRTAKFSLSVKF